MIIYFVTLILAVILGMAIANLIRIRKVRKALYENESLLERSTSSKMEDANVEDLMAMKENLGRLRGRMEVIKKLNYFFW